MGPKTLRKVRELGQAAQHDVRGRNAVFWGVTQFHKRKLRCLQVGVDEGLNTYYRLEMEAAGRFQTGVICQNTEILVLVVRTPHIKRR